MQDDVVGQGLPLPEGCPLLLNDALRRSLFAYHRLPQQLLKLSILKLDGSFFEVQVPKTATVAELKKAVEGLFSQQPEDKEIKISWSHVWGNFCLCYKGQKLINDKAYIRLLGIKDGDQLHFVQHLWIKYEREKRRVTKHRSFSGYYEQGTNVLWNNYT
ncbi:Ubiquitin-related domain containing protein [Trema orientale]|uniref:Ubiquitin-related domain containing protein n=1 Tax=Trema orientale TaxID=63057 RepID=A0A2P5FQ17_TREOI|nr:Ubiquitin-related domain containing protein [Trema orientale]